MNQIRQKVKLFLNNAIRAKVKEYESLCKKYPEFAIERELPEGGITKGGFLQDLEVWRYALLPNPEDPKRRTLIDELMPNLEEISDFGTRTATIANVYSTDVPWPQTTVPANDNPTAPQTSPEAMAGEQGGKEE